MAISTRDLLDIVEDVAPQRYRNAKQAVRVYLRLRAMLDGAPGCLDYERMSEPGRGEGVAHSGHPMEATVSEKVHIEMAIHGALGASELFERRIWRLVRIEGVAANEAARQVSISRVRAYAAVGAVDGRVEARLGIKAQGVG